MGLLGLIRWVVTAWRGVRGEAGQKGNISLP